MVLNKLEVTRYQDKNKSENKFYYGVQILDNKFHYLITKPSSKTSIEKYNNNFYGAYFIDNQIYLLSIEGVSIFDFNMKNRCDFKLNRGRKIYRKIEKMHNSENFCELEKILKAEFYKNI